MKILMVNKFLYPKGGDAISTLETGKLLTKNGHEVVFWGMEHPSNEKFPFEEFFVSYVDYNKRNGIWQEVKNSIKILYSLEAKNKINGLIYKWKPDIVHLNNFAHQISPSILGVFKKNKIPVVMTLHDYKLVCPTYSMLLNGKPCEKCKNKKFYNCLLNKCTKGSVSKSIINTVEMYLHHRILHIYNNISIFISPSIFLMGKVKEMGFNRDIVYIPNFIDTEKYEPNYNFKEQSIIYFGRLSKEKGLATLINAFKNLDVKLKIIGSGPCENELKDMVKNNKIDNIYFMGHKQEEELRDIIGETLFVVIPSECYENNPRSVLESFALGKPVIGSRIGGIPELVIDGETGFTFKAGDVEDLRDKIEYLLDNTDKIGILGRNARKLVEEKFNPNNHYNKLLNIYNKAIEKQGGND